MDTADVVIAGGGIIGLSMALELATAGLRVTVIERGNAMRESSWAAAGMLAAADPENPSALRPLSDHSMRLYPQYIQQVEDLSGQPIPLRTTRVLQVISAEHRPALPSQSAAVLPGAELPMGEARSSLLQLVNQLVTCEHNSIPEVVPGFLLLDEPSLDPRDLCTALPLAVRAAGVTLLEQTTVIGTRSSTGDVEIKTSQGSFAAAAFVNCCGAWAAQLTAQTTLPRTGPAVEPRKGQILIVQLRGGETLPCVIRTPDIYLVPRGDGRVVIGATVEHAGFDKQIDPDAIQSLIRQAAELWPAIGHASLIESWSGLRPATPDGLPILGENRSAGPNHWIATGHFRNGILLAPATAQIMSHLIQGISPEIDIRAFRSERFQPAVSDKAPTAAL